MDALRPCSRRQRSVTVRDDLRSLAGYHSPQVDVPIRLNTNESPEPPPSEWEAELRAALADVAWNRYPDRSAADLRAAIAAFHGVDPTQVFAANGSNEVLQTILLAYGGSGRNVATFEPTYQLHGHIGRLTGTRAVEGERARDFTLDLDEVERVAHDETPAITFLCSPNNPTGLVETRHDVDHVLDCASGLVVIDEAYGQFADWSAIDMVGEDVDLVVVRTFSKTWSMAAARLGYAIGPSWVVADLETVTLPYHLDSAKQIAGRLALRYVDEMERRVAAVVAGRHRVAEGLASMPVDVIPSGANFILFRPRHMAAVAVWTSLLERGVLIRDCSRWPRLTNWLRVTIGNPDENDSFLSAISDVLR